MASRTTVVRLAVEGIQANITALKRMGDEGQTALGRLGVGAAAANSNVERLDKSLASAGARAGRSNLFQQAGYQLGDFAVQVQSGTNAMVAFTQQGSQFIGAFGTVGAVLGGVLSIVGAFATYLMRSSQETETAQKALDELNHSTDEYRATLELMLPQQKAYLENQIALAGATKDAAKAQTDAIFSVEAARARQKEQTPFGMPPGGIPPPGVQQGLGQAPNYGFQAPSAEMQRTLQRALENAQAAQREIERNRELEQTRLRNIKGGGVGGISGASDYLGQAGAVETFDEALAKLTATQEKKAAQDAAAAKQAETTRIANAKLLETAKLNTQAAQDETDALTMGEDARKRANVEREYELKLLEAAQPANKAVTEELIAQAEALRDAKLATIERSRAIEDAQAKIDASPDAAGGGGLGFHGIDAAKAEQNRQQLIAYGNKQVTQDEKDFARIQEDILTEPWRNLATNVSQITTNMFDEILTKGKVSFQSLADGVGNMFKTTITGALGNIAAAPVNMLAAKFAQPGGFDFSQMTYGQGMGTAAAAGGAGGYAAGTIYAKAAGKEDTYAATGAGIGGALGGAAGFAATGGNPLGAAGGAVLGSMAGAFIGGMFGGEGLGNDQSVQKFGSKVGKAIWSDKSFSEENRKVTGGIIEQLSMLGEALTASGADIKNFQLAITAGNKTGIQVGGKKYETADEALVGAIKTMLANTGGLQGSQVTALGTTKGRNVQEVMADLQFAQEFDKITFSGTVAEASMRDLTMQFDALGRRARALGLDENALAAARVRAMDQLMQAAARQQRAQAATFYQMTAPDALNAQLSAIDEQFRAAIDNFSDLGYSQEQQNELWAARQRTMDQAVNAEGERVRAQAQAEAQARAAASQQAKADADARRQQAIADAEARKRAQREARGLSAQYFQTVTTSDLARTISQINEQFAQLTDTMKDAGWKSRELNQVEKARVRAVAEATEQFRRQQRDISAQYHSAIHGEFEAQIIAINQQFAQLSDTLKDAGYNAGALKDVEQARVRAVAAAIEQEKQQAAAMKSDIESKILGIGSFYDQLIQPLQAINQNNLLNPAGQIGGARQAFQADLSGAGARDPEAIRRLAGSAQQYQQLLSQNYGTAGAGGQGLREIQAGLTGTIAGLQQEKGMALADLPQVVQKTTLDIIRENRADIDRVVEQLEGLRRDLRGRGIAA